MFKHITSRFSPYQIGVALAFLASTGFAAKAIFAKLAYRYGVDAVTLVTLRMILAGSALQLIRFYRAAPAEPLSRAQKWGIVGLGILGYYLSSILDFIGLETVSASLERLILCLYPTFTIVFGAVLLGQSISKRVLLAMPLTYLGIALVLLPDLAHARSDWIGILFVLASTLSFALYMTLSPKLITQVGSMRFTELGLTVSSLAMLLHFVLTRPIGTLVQTPEVWAYAGLIAVFSTILPVYATTAAMQRIGGGRTALIGSFGPVLTIIFSVSILGETLGALQWLGAAIVLAGVWIVGKKG
ncbi:DMT family transporter [Chitinibacter sp. FCG-7]|uniref:DMT family transporter n=1 Tax=Chitinibacter mangrovi TaxID=3153927 RepID=A0AAU7F6J7_9NEIS